MKILLNSIKFSDRIAKIARALNTTYKEDCNEYILQFDNEFGTGFISGYNFANGFGLFIVNAEFTEPLELIEDFGDRQPMNIFYNTSKIVKFKAGNRSFQLNNLQTAIFAAKADQKTHFIFPPDQQITFVNLGLVRTLLIKKIECDLHTLPEKLEKVFRDLHSEHSFLSILKYGIHLSRNLNRILTNELRGLERKTFQESMSLGLFSLSLRQYREEKKLVDSENYALRNSDVDLLLKAREILEEQYANPPTIAQLARKIGTNTNKLQKGFRLLFNRSIKEFIVDKRMDRARIRLASPNINVNEVATEVGYQNKSYFSRVFQKHYGMLPRDYQKMVKAENIGKLKSKLNSN